MAISSGLGSSALLPAGLGFRNEIINGGFQVDQRNNGSSQTITAGAALAYTVDRWYAYCTGANVTGQRISGTAPFQNFYQFTGAASNTAVGFGQRIEAASSFNCAGQTVALSAWLRSSSLTTVTWTLFYANTTDTFGTLASPTRTQIATGTFTITSTLAQYRAVVQVPAAATTGLELVFTAGALTAANTLVFAGVQLEQNYQPTPFEQRPIGMELALCQRYYQRFLGGTNGLFYGYGYADSIGTAYNATFPLKGTMRATPTIGVIGTVTGFDVLTQRTVTAFTSTRGSTEIASGDPSYSGGTFNANRNMFYFSGAGNNGVDFSAEL